MKARIILTAVEAAVALLALSVLAGSAVTAAGAIEAHAGVPDWVAGWPFFAAAGWLAFHAQHRDLASRVRELHNDVLWRLEVRLAGDDELDDDTEPSDDVEDDLAPQDAPA